jgi:hypothetical protein
MGMDLVPINPNANAPLDKYGNIQYGFYNLSKWGRFRDLLILWHIYEDELNDFNDGEIISFDTCLIIADALDAHFEELCQEDKDWLKGHSQLWRTCGGYRQC